MLRNQQLNSVLEALKASSKELEKALGDDFLGMALFGSWARSEAKKDSDVDIFVLLKRGRGLRLRSSIYRIIAKHVKKHLRS